MSCTLPKIKSIAHVVPGRNVLRPRSIGRDMMAALRNGVGFQKGLA